MCTVKIKKIRAKLLYEAREVSELRSHQGETVCCDSALKY